MEMFCSVSKRLGKEKEQGVRGILIQIPALNLVNLSRRTATSDSEKKNQK